MRLTAEEIIAIKEAVAQYDAEAKTYLFGSRIASFRNFLAHDYEKVDYLVICEQTLKKLDDVKAYLRFVKKHCKRSLPLRLIVTDIHPPPVIRRCTSAKYPLRMDIRNDLGEGLNGYKTFCTLRWSIEWQS